MKEVPDIVLRLTLTCVLAASVMGGVFMLTNEAKLHNEHISEQNVMLGLLGYGLDNPAPASVKLFNIYRYIISKGENKFLGYILPVKGDIDNGFQLVMIDLEGQFAEKFALSITPEKVSDAGERDKVLIAALPGDMHFFFADEAIIVNDGDKRQAYLLPGQFPGFKTFIKVFLALDPQLSVLGFDVVAHEEDPGLGAEIEKDYFKNQFAGKTVEAMKTIKVVKVPLPDEYRKYLEEEKQDIKMLEAEQEAIRQKYKDADIHALTGATISSDAVTNGLKNMLKKFVYRLQILENVINEQSIPVSF
ncbi:MAG: FMN-binding protein [Gammaproteobacteria bacterium RBG_16_51_14]|nr:MAG: FMN-binding protein [Gammaproteobacteria bacterium RBG_16_51_14]